MKQNRIDRPPLRLFFKNPVFAKGVQSTCRLGNKWRDDLEGVRKAAVPLVDTETHEQVGNATIIGHLYGKYSTVWPISAGCQHDEECRTKEGLDAAMVRAYGEEFDPERSSVTIVFFTVEQDNTKEESAVGEGPGDTAQE